VYASNVANFENVSGGHWDTRPTMRKGGMVMSARGGYDVFVAPDGTTTIDATAIKQDGKLGASIKMSSRTSASLQQQSEHLESSAVGEAVTAAHSTAAALGQIADFSRTHAKNQRDGTHYGSGDRGEFSQAASSVTKTMDSFAEKNNLNQKQVTELFGMAQTGASVPGALKLISPVDFEAKTGIKAGSAAEASALIEKARSTMSEQGFTTAMNKARQSVRERMFDTGDESSRRAADGIRTSLDQSQQHTDQASASHQQSLAYKAAASRVQENAATFDAGLTRQFVEWMRTLDNPISGRKFDSGTVVQMAEKNPELLEPFKDRFFKERIEPQLVNGVGEVKGAEAVRGHFEQGKAAIPGKENVTAQGNDWLGVVKGTATSAGVNPGKPVTSSLPDQVGKSLEKTGVQVVAGKVAVDTKGQPIKQKAVDETDHGKQNLLGMAVMNGADALLPGGLPHHREDAPGGADVGGIRG
jgi:conjugal transfer mating pair stabilization protein TraG